MNKTFNLKNIYIIFSSLFIALGVVHLSVTAFIFSNFTESTLWFTSGGLMGLFVGFLNLAIIRTNGKDRIINNLGMFANLLTAIFFITGIILVEKSPQGYLGLILILSLVFINFKFVR